MWMKLIYEHVNKMATLRFNKSKEYIQQRKVIYIYIYYTLMCINGIGFVHSILYNVQWIYINADVHIKLDWLVTK